MTDRPCTPEDVAAYRKLLLEIGVAFEVVNPSDLCGRVLGSNLRDKGVANLVEQGFFSTPKRDLLVLPPDKRVLTLVRDALKTDRGYEPLARRLEEAASKKGIVLPAPLRGATCVRSPCLDDGKVSLEELEQARTEVGTPKKRVRRPNPSWPLAVSFGLGVDSTAVLVGLAQLVREGREEFRPSFITFGDTGNERPETYGYLEHVNRWLDKVGFPNVTVCALETKHTGKGYGTSRTLEQQCLINQSMPSISQSKKQFAKCSKLWKQDAQNNWFRNHSGLFERKTVTKDGRKKKVWSLIRGVPRILKAIGYDANETNRERKGTFRTADDRDSSFYGYWTPLIDWGWDRARCVAEIEAAKIATEPPVKSACHFCGMAKKAELRTLPKDLLLRSILIEEVAKRSKRLRFPKRWLSQYPDGIPQNELMAMEGNDGNRGLGITFAWSDFALEEGLITRADYERTVDLAKKILAEAPKEKGSWDAATGPVLSRTPAFRNVLGFRSTGEVWTAPPEDDEEADLEEDEEG